MSDPSSVNEVLCIFDNMQGSKGHDGVSSTRGATINRVRVFTTQLWWVNLKDIEITEKMPVLRELTRIWLSNNEIRLIRKNPQLSLFNTEYT